MSQHSSTCQSASALHLTNDRLWSVRDVASFLNTSERTIWRWVAQGKFPKPSKLNGVTRWLPQDVLGFAADRLVESRR